MGRETDIDDHQGMLDFLEAQNNPKTHRKELPAIPISPEKTKAAAAATETSKEDGLATGSEKAGTNAEKKRKALTFGEEVLSTFEPLLLRTKWRLWGNLLRNIVSKLLFGVLSH